MPWGNVPYYPNIWVGLMVGFGILVIAMLIGFYVLLKSLGEVKANVNNCETKLESIEEKVDKVVKQLEEI